MESYFVALTPEDRICAEISKAKSIILERFGEQKFLLDKPHSTIYVGVTNDLKDVEKQLKEIALKQNSIRVNLVEEWQEFKEDKLAGGGNSLSLKFTEESNKDVLILQKKIINVLNWLREGEVHSRYKNLQLSKPFLESVQKYGFPFVSGNDNKPLLIPHIGFCCFANYEDAQKFKELCNIKKFAGPAKFSKLSLYKLDADEKSTLIKHFPLQ